MKHTIAIVLLGCLGLCACHRIKVGTTPTPPEPPKEVPQSQNSRQFASALSGDWELTYIAGIPKEFDQFYKGKKPAISFDLATNRVSGNTSCNSFSGPFTINQSNIDLKGPMAMTKMYCEGGGEAAFLEALQKVTSFSSDGNTLDLISGDIGVMQFRRK